MEAVERAAGNGNKPPANSWKSLPRVADVTHQGHSQKAGPRLSTTTKRKVVDRGPVSPVILELPGGSETGLADADEEGAFESIYDLRLLFGRRRASRLVKRAHIRPDSDVLESLERGLTWFLRGTSKLAPFRERFESKIQKYKVE